MPFLTVLHKGAHRFEVNVEGHRLLVDEGAAAGGRNSGPTPTELLAASLASCAAAYAESYLVAHGYRTAGLAVTCHYRLSPEHPARVASIDVSVNTPADLPDDRRMALLRAVEQCMVGNTLRMPPTVNVTVVGLGRRTDS
jgi:putative redox protein